MQFDRRRRNRTGTPFAAASFDDDPVLRRRLLLRLMVLLAVPLAVVAALCIAFAEPVVPLLFGESWRPAADLLRWMVGVVFFYSLFTVAKTYIMALRQTRLLIVARLMQWAALLVPVAPWLWGAEVGVRDVAMGLSLSYLVAFVATFGMALRLR